MKTALLLTLLLLAPFLLRAQDEKKEKKQPKPGIGLGLKAGVNFANITNASQISASNTSGFHAGAFFAPGAGMGKKILGYRTEIIFSKQGYDFKSGATTGSVKLDYILMPQLMTINITRFFEIHFGMQMAFLLNAKADSSKPAASGNPYGAIMDYYNRFDYGLAGGVQIMPVAGLFIGARYNISLSNLYNNNNSSQVPVFIPNGSDINFKNNVIQLYGGWRF
jgi:hypothetical protein